MKKIILHLCADIGSDSRPYADNGYDVRLVGKDIGVEHYTPPLDVYGIIANPVCTEFSIADHDRKRDIEKGLFLVKHCERIIAKCASLRFWVIENPATGLLKRYLGKPRYSYEPWEYGPPWTKRTALWGNFIIPTPTYTRWEDVPKNPDIYVRLGRRASMAWLHKSAIHNIPEFARFIPQIHDDMSLRSLCSQNFAQAFFKANP